MCWSPRRKAAELPNQPPRPSVLAAVGLAFALWVAALVFVPAGAEAAARTLHLRYGPIALHPAELQTRAVRVRTPRVAGFVTRMHAVVTDARGRRLPTERVMLHHA